MLEQVVSNIPAGVCFVLAGCNVGLQVVKFEDGLSVKKAALAALHKTKREVEALDKVLRLEAAAAEALKDRGRLGSRKMTNALELISQAIIECSNGGHAGAAKAAELETMREHALQAATATVVARVAAARNAVAAARQHTLLFSSVSMDAWSRGPSVRSCLHSWSTKRRARQCASALQQAPEANVEQEAESIECAAGALQQALQHNVTLEQRLARLEHQAALSQEAARGAL